ncbi:hypothetical protein [Staphylococcus cohnii]|uniref:hypothetical protein n=1 Tax=Staphylococcus cohnii TaxID=29382 RepID=UPI000D1A721E|nr:hypothetical protein [Staphylococcus cohnii]PTF09602.1 hypothetical protein BUY36_00205 [Staphylococcus cohnii]PTG68769.1 hypothetical protein BUY28_00570 [Staphylococcus cohnii]
MDDNVVIVGGSIVSIFAVKKLSKKGIKVALKKLFKVRNDCHMIPPLMKAWMQDNENTAIPLLEKENFLLIII